MEPVEPSEPADSNTPADIPLENEPEDTGYQSDDSHNVQDAGSDDEGEDLQENAARFCVVLYTVTVNIVLAIHGQCPAAFYTPQHSCCKLESCTGTFQRLPPKRDVGCI